MILHSSAWNGELECRQVRETQEPVLGICAGVPPDGDCDSDLGILCTFVYMAWLSDHWRWDHSSFGGKKPEQCLLSSENILTSLSGIIEKEHVKNRTLYVAREAIQILKSYPLISQWQGEG